MNPAAVKTFPEDQVPEEAIDTLRDAVRKTVLEPGFDVGPYRLESRLGGGAQAEVWLATRHGAHGFTRKLALRVLRDADPRTADARDRAARREAMICARLDHHANIAKVEDMGITADGLLFSANEYVDGISVFQLLLVHRVLHIQLALGVACEVLRALRYAHGVGVLHRDVSPNNVLISTEGNVKLVDFGLAALIGVSSGTSPPSATPGFAAPEGPMSACSDVFSVGALLWTMVAGSVSAALPDHLGQGVVAFMRTMVHRDPAARYASADEALAALVALGIRVAGTEDMRRFLSQSPPLSATGEPGSDGIPSEISAIGSGHTSDGVPVAVEDASRRHVVTSGRISRAPSSDERVGRRAASMPALLSAEPAASRSAEHRAHARSAMLFAGIAIVALAVVSIVLAVGTTRRASPARSTPKVEAPPPARKQPVVSPSPAPTRPEPAVAQDAGPAASPSKPRAVAPATRAKQPGSELGQPKVAPTTDKVAPRAPTPFNSDWIKGPESEGPQQRDY